MWGILAKIVAVCFVTASVILLIKKRAEKGRIRRAALLLTSVLMALYVGIFPIENLFFSFASAEEVFQYACRGQLLGIAGGTASDLIVYETGNHTFSFMVAPKSPDGYKIGHFFSLKKVAYVADSGYSLTIYRDVGGTDNYVLLHGFTAQGTPQVKDEYGSDFTVSTLTAEESTSVVPFVAFAHLADFDGTYLLTINEEQFLTVG